MKILFVTPLYPPEIGGPATYAKLLVEELPKRGHMVTLVKYSDFAHLPSGIRHLSLMCHLYRLAKSHDVIYAQDVFSVGAPSASASFFARVPLIVRVPGDYAWEQSVQKFGVTDSVDEFQFKRYGLKIEFLRIVQKWVVKKARVVIAPSGYFASLVEGWGSSQKVRAIYNGVDINELSQYSKTSYDVEGKFSIVSAGRLVPWKEFDVLIGMLKNHPTWELILVGDGPERNSLGELARRLGVVDQVHLLGRLPQKELWYTIAQADVYVHNSTFESFSYQVVEVMALGTPLVAKNVGNISELVTSANEGILVSPHKDDELEQVIKTLENDVHARKTLGMYQKLRADFFSINSSIDKLEEILKEINH